MYKFDKIEERDVDFIIMRAFVETSSLRALFLDKTKWSGASVVSIEHSLTDLAYGESDITVIIKHDSKKYALLIENKIDADAMPEQCLRYNKRGEIGVSTGEYDDFAVFLIAPENYIKNNNEAQKYINKISYEEISRVFERENRLFDQNLIESAIQKQAKGYVVNEVPEISLFWHKLYKYCCSVGRKLEMYPVNGPKGLRSMWPRFKSSLDGTELYYKADQGVVDLQFSGKAKDGVRLKNSLFEIKDGDMHWEKTGNSLSLRIKVKSMDFNKEFESYTNELDVMIDAVERFTLLSRKLNDMGYII
ncbi:MAG: PD-(D/E)XK nuclease family protein [Clostridia bacterium]|nr:PD-(D/E)XK nuclease family protein [Clostridia bacterium]